jgi:CubicO group peptidase (beta-lactamase class C family)
MKQSYFILLYALLLAFGCKEIKQETELKESLQINTVVDSAAVKVIDSVLKSFVDRGQIAGISALIYEKDKEVYYNAFGYADRESKVPMDRNTIVQIYSMTKPVTGVALMTLYEEGAFQLDDPLEKYLPEYSDVKVYTGVDNNGKMLLEEPNRPITVRDITRHTAGFPNRPDIPGLSEKLQEADIYKRENTLAELNARLGSVPLWFHPGDQWEYGPCVDVQAYLVEKISGSPFEEYTREHVLDPLGMDHTRYYIPEEDREHFAAMYRKTGDSLNREPDEEAKSDYLKKWPLRRGGSGLTSTLDDYMTFARMLLRQGSLNGVTVLSPETIQLMATNQLADSVTERNFLPSKGQVGFGIDFAVRQRAPASDEENYGVVGEFFWDGAASTLFWVDPLNELTAVMFVQLFPFDQIGLHKNFRSAVYSSYKETPVSP